MWTISHSSQSLSVDRKLFSWRPALRHHVLHAGRTSVLVTHDSIRTVAATGVCVIVFCACRAEVRRCPTHFLVAGLYPSVHLWWTQCLFLCHCLHTPVHAWRYQGGIPAIPGIGSVHRVAVPLQVVAVSATEWAAGHICFRSDGTHVCLVTDSYGQSVSHTLSVGLTGCRGGEGGEGEVLRKADYARSGWKGVEMWLQELVKFAENCFSWVCFITLFLHIWLSWKPPRRCPSG